MDNAMLFCVRVCAGYTNVDVRSGLACVVSIQPVAVAIEHLVRLL